jgi:hypothetical protein
VTRPPSDNEPRARKSNAERKLRHKNRVERLERMPKVKEGRNLADERERMDEPDGKKNAKHGRS